MKFTTKNIFCLLACVFANCGTLATKEPRPARTRKPSKLLDGSLDKILDLFANMLSGAYVGDEMTMRTGVKQVLEGRFGARTDEQFTYMVQNEGSVGQYIQIISHTSQLDPGTVDIAPYILLTDQKQGTIKYKWDKEKKQFFKPCIQYIEISLSGGDEGYRIKEEIVSAQFKNSQAVRLSKIENYINKLTVKFDTIKDLLYQHIEKQKMVNMSLGNIKFQYYDNEYCYELVKIEDDKTIAYLVVRKNFGWQLPSIFIVKDNDEWKFYKPQEVPLPQSEPAETSLTTEAP